MNWPIIHSPGKSPQGPQSDLPMDLKLPPNQHFSIARLHQMIAVKQKPMTECK